MFISYRREESSYAAGWLFERLRDRFGEDQVFKDVDSIALGDDFVERITRAIESCRVLVAVIGASWLAISDENGLPRLEDPQDFVRVEIETALARGVRVIPVLVDGAQMPRTDELPDALEGLARRQAIELNPSRFGSDTRRLVEVVASTLGEAAGPLPADRHLDGVTSRAGTVVPPRGAKLDDEDLLKVPSSTTADGGHRNVGRTIVQERPSASSRRTPVIAIAVAGIVVGVALVWIILVVAVRDGDRADTAATSPDGLELTDYDITLPNEPALVGDTVTVRYSLRNVTDEPIHFAWTFVAVRDEAGNRDDTGHANAGFELAAGDTLRASGRVLLDATGEWKVFPCYELSSGQFCPEEWQYRPISVE